MKINILENQSLPDGSKGKVGYVNNTDDVFYLIPPITCIKNMPYVYSMWVKADEDRNIAITRGSDSDVTFSTKANEWVRVILPFTANGQQVYVELQEGIYMLYRAQLEQGTIPSDWSKSTIDTEIETRSEITQLADSVAISVKELQNGIEANSAEIEVQKGQIALKVNQGELSSSISLEEGDINIVGNRIGIKSDFFELTQDGKIKATSGNVGSLSVDEKSVKVEIDNFNAYPVDEQGRHYAEQKFLYTDTSLEEGSSAAIVRMYQLEDSDNTYVFEVQDVPNPPQPSNDEEEYGEVGYFSTDEFSWDSSRHTKEVDYPMKQGSNSLLYHVLSGDITVNRFAYIVGGTEITESICLDTNTRQVYEDAEGTIGQTRYPQSIPPEYTGFRTVLLSETPGNAWRFYYFTGGGASQHFNKALAKAMLDLAEELNKIIKTPTKKLEIGAYEFSLGDHFKYQYATDELFVNGKTDNTSAIHKGSKDLVSGGEIYGNTYKRHQNDYFKVLNIYERAGFVVFNASRINSGIQSGNIEYPQELLDKIKDTPLVYKNIIVKANPIIICQLRFHNTGVFFELKDASGNAYTTTPADESRIYIYEVAQLFI